MNSVYFQAGKRRMSDLLNVAPDISLLKEDQVPHHLREVAILSGYRSPYSSVKECALSVFIATNETFNFWTHFIPTLYFLWQLVTFWDILRIISDPYSWPFTAYMFTICLYPLISALAHTFYSTSDMARHIWFLLDYGALSLYGFSAGLLIKAYVFPHEWQNSFYADIFLGVLFVLAFICSVMACYSRFITNLFWIKIFRLGAFALPWLWDSYPVVYRILQHIEIDTLAIEHYCMHFFFCFCIFFFYASHLPERLAPGKFDILGHSHQLLHISGILATHQQMSGAFIDMKNRRDVILNNFAVPDYWSICIFPLLFLSITMNIALFVFLLKRHEKKVPKVKK